MSPLFHRLNNTNALFQPIKLHKLVGLVIKTWALGFGHIDMFFMTNRGINPALVIKTYGWKDEAIVTGLEIVQGVPQLLCGEEEEINTEFQLEAMLRASKLHRVAQKGSNGSNLCYVSRDPHFGEEEEI